MIWEKLPEDIWSNIFLRLPMKTLVICACTWKPMLNFITSPEFMATHNKNSKDNPFILLRYYVEGQKRSEYVAIHPDDGFSDTNLMFQKLPTELNPADNCFNIVGTCNGVICLSDDITSYTNRVYLWNPSIRKVVKVPYLKFTFGPCGPYEMCVGFGYDEVTNDYKVVRLVYLENGSEPEHLPPLVEVYSVSSGAWRSITTSAPMYYIRQYSCDGVYYSQCYLNGNVHWPGYIMQDRKGMCGLDSVWKVIVTFNVCDEVFGELKLPACFEGSNTDYRLRVTTCCDMLALILMLDEECGFSIWVMKEYGIEDSWTESFRFSNPAVFPFPRALYFRKNENMLMLANGCCCYLRSRSVFRVLSIDCDEDQRQVLETLKGALEGIYLGSYNEGLALFKEGKTMSNGEVRVDELNAGADMSKNLPCGCDIPIVVAKIKIERLP